MGTPPPLVTMLGLWPRGHTLSFCRGTSVDDLCISVCIGGVPFCFNLCLCGSLCVTYGCGCVGHVCICKQFFAP